MSAQSKVYRRGKESFTVKEIMAIAAVSMTAAQKRLRLWEQGKRSTEWLLMDRTKSKPKPLTSMADMQEEMLRRIPEPSPLERKVFG